MSASRGLEPLFHPRSVAVVGASSDPRRLGGIPIRLMREQGFPGALYPINPNREEIGGYRCYPDVASLPETPDVALFSTPRGAVLPALRQCAGRGVRFAVVFTSGFKETGAEGAALQEEMVRLCRAGGMRLLGPNCMGVIDVRARLMATFTISIREGEPLSPGPVALVTHSGAMAACVISDLHDAGSGLSAMASLGNEADIGFAECVDHFVDDPGTRVICGYLEAVRDGRRMRSAAARALAAGKPIVLLKSGATEAGARAAMSHTAALTTPHGVFTAFARQYGITLCGSHQELIETVEFLAHVAKPRGRRLGVLSFSGGAGSLVADAAVQEGFTLPPLAEGTLARLRRALPEYAALGNPVDLVSILVSRPGESPLFEAAAAVRDDPGTDAVALVMGVYHHVAGQVAEAFRNLFAGSAKPFACCWMAPHRGELQALRKSGVPVLEDYDRAVRALAALLRFHEAAAAEAVPKPAPDPARRERALQMIARAPKSPEGMLPLSACGALLGLYGIRRPAQAEVSSVGEAVAAWREMGGPVALKVVSGQLVHKTEAGGVSLGLDGEGDLRAEAARLLGLAPDARLLVQKMAGGGVELLAGLSRDPAFGLCVTGGIGGIFVEVFEEVARRLPPFGESEAVAMLRGLRGAKLLQGARGRPAVNAAAAAQALARLSEMAAELDGALDELDINPLIVTPEEALAVDVRVRVLPPGGP
ncbi:MAG: acetate--CoA ligase family protein [Nitrospinota bacterium]